MKVLAGLIVRNWEGSVHWKITQTSLHGWPSSCHGGPDTWQTHLKDERQKLIFEYLQVIFFVKFPMNSWTMEGGNLRLGISWKTHLYIMKSQTWYFLNNLFICENFMSCRLKIYLLPSISLHPFTFVMKSTPYKVK